MFAAGIPIVSAALSVAFPGEGQSLPAVEPTYVIGAVSVSNNARLRLWQGIWWEMTAVTCAIFVLVLVFNHLADELRDILDPALRNERS